MQDIRIDAEGNHHCWKCGGTNFTEKRTLRSKAAVGVGALLTKKKLKCQDCGEYNDTGSAKPFVAQEDKTLADMSISERVAARKAGTLPKMTFKEQVAANKAAIADKKAAKHQDHSPAPAPPNLPTAPIDSVTPVQATAEAQTADPAEQLKKLAELHESGLITDDEFAVKRAALIERL
jgi:hypothetical protein